MRRWLAIAALLGSAALLATLSTRGPARVEPREELAPPHRDSEVEVAGAERAQEMTEAPAPDIAEPEEGAPVAAAPERRWADVVQLSGVVHPAEGCALPEELALTATDLDGATRSAPIAANGAYVLELAPGSYRLTCRTSAAGEVELELQLNPWEPERRLDLELEHPRELVVRVALAARERAKALSAVATREPPGEWFPDIDGGPSLLHALGSFFVPREELPADAIGLLALDVAPPVFVSLVHHQRVLATQRVEPGEREVRFELDDASPWLQPVDLRFRFVDAGTLEPLEPRRAILEARGSRFLGSKDGEFRFPAAGPGRYRIHAWLEGYSSLPYDVLVEPGLSGELQDIPLERGVWIGGQVVDEKGEGFAARLRVDPLDEETGLPVTSDAITEHRTERDGHFRIGGLGRGVYLVRPHVSGLRFGRTCARVDTRRVPVDLVRIEVLPAVTLRLSAEEDQRAELRYRILDAGRELVTFGDLRSEGPTLVPLAPGTYTLESRIGPAEPVCREITLADEPLDLDLP